MRPSMTEHSSVAAPPIRGVHLSFRPSVEMAHVSDTLELARLATESLHGPERVQLDARWEMDDADRSVAIDSTSEVGRTLAIVFLGFVKREFGSGAVHVVRMGSHNRSRRANR
jgi:hypothetical protein